MLAPSVMGKGELLRVLLPHGDPDSPPSHSPEPVSLVCSVHLLTHRFRSQVLEVQESVLPLGVGGSKDLGSWANRARAMCGWGKAWPRNNHLVLGPARLCHSGTQLERL